MRVLITGMSGVGKSAVVEVLRQRGFAAYDADDDGLSAPDSTGAWHWRIDAVTALLSSAGEDLLFFAGCSDEQRDFSWDVIVLLTVDPSTMIDRLRTRSSNSYGQTAEELAQIQADRKSVEPLLRRVADLVVYTEIPVAQVTDTILRFIARS